MKINFFSLIGTVSFFAFFACSFSHAQCIGNHDESWQIIKTEHFEVIVSAQQHDLGLYYAHTAEKAYQDLSTIFNLDIKNTQKKIVLIVNDTTDVANGYATRIPYPHIMAYVVPVSEHDSISESGDWPRELITHELTHILQLEPASGFYNWLRPIFGNIIAPNMLTPLWWKEGMAVEMETQFSPRGRLRSTFQDATIRSFVLDNKWNEQTLPQANEILPSWPYGGRPYLFGSLLFSQLSFDTQDRKSSGLLANLQGKLLPYFIEQPLFDLTHYSYQSQYDNALKTTESNSLQQIEILKKSPLSEIKNIKYDIKQDNNKASFLPTYSDQFKLLAFIENIESENILTILDENHAKLDLKNRPTGELLSLDFHPNEKKILYSKIIKPSSKYILSDLYIYNIETDQSERLTTSLRARSARYSEDGQSIVFMTTSGGQTHIKTMDLKTKQISSVLSSDYSSRYESPIFWSEKTLLASKVNANGEHSLVRINLNPLTEEVVPFHFPQIRFLQKVKETLYFVSSKNGVNNIYVSKDLKTARPVSHVLSGVWSFDISEDQARSWASLMTSSGFKISEIKLFEYAEELPVIENEIEKRYSYNEPEYTPQEYQFEDYHASSYLLPTYWIPFVTTSSSSKGIFLQAQTSGFDPLKKHEYAIAANYNSELNKGNFSGIYTNSTQEIPFQASSISQSWALGTTLNIVQTTTHALSLLPDIFTLNKNMRFQIGAQLHETKYYSNSQHWGPFTQLTYKNYEQNLFQISPQSGWGALLKFEKNLKLQSEGDASVRDFERAALSWIGFASPWLPQHHALKAKISGLFTFSSNLARFGASSSSTFVESDGLLPQFVMRGYTPAQFFGRNLWNTNFEYRFPISQIERGSGTDPYFFKRLSGAFVIDGIAVDGAALNKDLTLQGLKLNESIWSTGAELKLESSIGYVLPLNFILGYYIPHSPAFSAGDQLGLSLQIGGF